MSTPEEIADCLERAADALWLYGRTHGRGLSEDGSMCVRGAIAYALGLDPTDVFCVGLHNSPVNVALERYLGAHPDLFTDSLRSSFAKWLERGTFPSWVWSDRERDDELVIDTLRSCAKSLRPVELPDPHAAAQLRDEAMAERYAR